ncbi:MAG: phospholipid/cholesterol/gamma-HCH transport system substrate-binding protein, partial [Solirubrobacteraceae bacterium]|nr:phospholipid/cholesterol/gamma-HCH transport system substrate-binding protein [Solirubrobacteraceae bacterium]
GDIKGKPAPDGYVIPPVQTSTATDLDQLLSTLDPDTRMRLAVVVNELGTAFAGRKMDFQQFLDTFPPAVQSVSGLLTQLTKDNQALGNLVDTSDSYVASLTASRAQLSRAINVFSRTTETVASRRAELRETLRRAPAALVAARGFLSELRQTTGPLDQTAILLKQTAPSVNTLISRIGPLTAAAKPTLQTAMDRSAPALIGLSDISTAPAARVRTTLANLRPIAQNQVPVLGRTLDRSADNLLATIQNWSRAIQFRDGLGHIFRGEASFSPALYTDLIKGLGIANTNRAAKPRRNTPKKNGQVQQSPAPQQPQSTPGQQPTDALTAIGDLLKGVPDTKQTTQQLKQLIDNLGSKPLLPGMQPLLSQDDSKSTQSLLDFLLKP